jgi:hypothetical protein
MRIVPYMPLFTSSTTGFAPCCTAVASSWPVIMKSPSPVTATTTRSGWRSFAATAAGSA